jgi:hypothetical protein
VLDGGDRRDPVAVFERRDRVRVQRRRQLEPQLPLADGDLDREAGVAEDLCHPVVGGVDGRHEAVDPGARRHGGEVGQQDRADALPVPVVGDLERDLRRARAGQRPDIGGMPDDSLRRPHGGDHAVTVAAAAARSPPRHRLQVHARREEAQPQRLRREAGEQLAELVDV